MIAALLFLSAFAFIPDAHPLVDAYDLPKTALVGALSVAAWVSFHLRALKGEALRFPLLGPIAVFLVLAALSGINAANAHYFLYAFGAMLAGFSFFFYGANMKSSLGSLGLLGSTQKTQATQATQEPQGALSILWLAPVCVAVAYAATPWLGVTTTFGNQERGSAMVALAAAIAASQVKSQSSYAKASKDIPRSLGEGGKSKVKKAAALLLLAPIGLFLYQGQMRSAMAGLAIGLLVWLWATRPKAAAAISGAGLIMMWPYRASLASYLSFYDVRPALWEAAVRESQNFWPLGIGLGQWRLYSQAWIHDAAFGAGYWQELHNDYLQLLVEAGPVALGAWLYLLYKILFKNSKVQSSTSPLIIGLIAVMVNAVFLFPFQLPIESAWFWLIAGIYCGGRNG